MNSKRAKHVFDKMTQATMKELAEWNQVEVYSRVISETADLQKPIKRPEIKGFKFEQRFNPVRAASLQDEISDLVNAERWTS